MAERLRCAALAAMVTLSLTVSACSEGANDTGVGAATGSSAGAPAVPEPDTTYNRVRPTITREATAKFSRDGVLDGTDVALRASMDYAFNRQLMASAFGENADTALSLTRDMTPDAARDWRTAIAGYNSGAAGRKEHGGLVMSLTLYAAWSADELEGKDRIHVQGEGPAAVNPRIESVTSSLDPRGRLNVHVLSSADVRLVKNHRPVRMGIDRDQTFWMVKSGGSWKIDGWTGSLTAGQYLPDQRRS